MNYLFTYILFKNINPDVSYNLTSISPRWLKFIQLIFKQIFSFLKFKKPLFRKKTSRIIMQFVKSLLLFFGNFTINKEKLSIYIKNIKEIFLQRDIRNNKTFKPKDKKLQFTYKQFSKSLILALYS